MEHHLKCTKPVFRLLADKIKTAEIRLNDRMYQAGDRLYIYEGVDWDNDGKADILILRPTPDFPPVARSHIPERLVAVADVLSVIYGGQLGIEDGYVLMSLSPVKIIAYQTLKDGKGL